MKKLILILILLTCVVSGCTSTKSEEPGGVRTDSKVDVIDACQKLIALKELSAMVDGEGQLAIRKDVQFVAPDRYHIKFDDGTGAHVEMISVGS